MKDIVESTGNVAVSFIYSFIWIVLFSTNKREIYVKVYLRNYDSKYIRTPAQTNEGIRVGFNQ